MLQMILHSSITDLLNRNSIENTVLNFQKNILDIGQKLWFIKAAKLWRWQDLCFRFDSYKRLSHILLSEVNRQFRSIYNGNGFCFVDHVDIGRNHLCKDSLLLLQSGKKISDNFIAILKDGYFLGDCRHYLLLVPSVNLV